MKIKAAVLRGTQDPYAIEDVELAVPGVDELLVRVVATGMCHTDVLPRVEGFMGPPPIITGHEGAGVVEEVGSAVHGFKVDDHVVLSFASCRACCNCLSGHPAYCDVFFSSNLTGLDVGGHTNVVDADGRPVAGRWFGQSSFATHTVVAARNAVRVDRSLPLELLGPLGCGLQTGAGAVLQALHVTAGSSVVVTGVGAVGLAAVMAAWVAGASTIVAVDLNAARLELARELGATHRVDGNEGNVLEQIQASTAGGAQFGLDTTGVSAVVSTLINGLRPTGTAGLVGVQQGELVLESTALSVGRNVMGILEGDVVPQVFLPQLMRLWQQGRFPFDRLIECYPLAEINEVESATLSGKVVKPVLLPE